MKSLFEYAYKELAQDAFLMWVFDNYECEDEVVRKLAHILICEFCGINSNSEITNLKVEPQVKGEVLIKNEKDEEKKIKCRIDITVHFEVGEEKYALYIEDKTYSGEHNQIELYSQCILKKEGKENLSHVKAVFYKSYVLLPWEIEVIEEHNKLGEIKWKIYDLDKIIEVFEQLKNDTDINDNMIIKQYYDHLIDGQKLLKNEIKPTDNKLLPMWQGYFYNTVFKKISDEIKKNYKITAGKPGLPDYIEVFIQKKSDEGKKYPKLQLRSNMCTNDRFNIGIFNYDFTDEELELEENKIRFSKYKEKIQNDESKVFKLHNGKRMFAKYNSKGVRVTTDEEFVERLEQCINYLTKLIKEVDGD